MDKVVKPYQEVC